MRTCRRRRIQAAKLLWIYSIGCALGGSQQEDAKILLEHYRAMGGGNGSATTFVSGFKTNPVDASFLQRAHDSVDGLQRH